MDRGQAAHEALFIAERLLDPRRVLSLAPGRAATSLQALAGTALLHARLAHVDGAFEAAAHAHWAAAAATPRPPAARPGVFDAVGGMAASLILAEGYLADPELRRHDVRAAVRWLAARTTAKASDWCDRRRGDPTTPASWNVYDAITGLAGSGRVLLAALERGHQEAEPGLLAALSTLTTLITTPHSPTRPGWWLPPDHRHAGAAPAVGGLAETGMAHGVAGPLALLSTAANAGYVVDGQITAIRTAASWLLAWQVPGTHAWPPYLTGAELDQQTTPADTRKGRYDAWCYGTPGISRALQAAGEALRDARTAQAGCQALASMADRAWSEWDTDGAGLCHGVAGVLQCAVGQPGAVHAASALDSGRGRRGNSGSDHRDGPADPGLLSGESGIALALADYAGVRGHDRRTRWDAVLLLS